ncbi:MAG: hypothetical protein R3A50_16550 [Saprospiraceae bacterium]
MAISLTFSYHIYVKYLGSYNFGIAFGIFSALTLVTLKTVYLPIQQVVLKFVKVPIVNADENMEISVAFKRRGGLIIFTGLLSAFSFCCMLPYLNNVEAAFLFIVSSSFGRLIQVPLAVKFFDDRIANPRYYYFWLIVSIIGGVIFQVGSIKAGLASTKISIVLAACLSTSFNCIKALVFRGITTKSIAKKRYVPVKTTCEIITGTETIIGVIVGLFILPEFTNTSIVFPDYRQTVALFVIGSLVPIAGTIASRLVNELSQPIVRAVDGIRITLGLFITIIFAIMTNETDRIFFNFNQKLIGIAFIMLGVYCSLAFGKPQKPDYAKSIK